MQLRLHSFILVPLLEIVLSQIDKNNYGPYDLDWISFEKCKGPKPRDCGKYEIADTRNMSDVLFRFDYDNVCPITTARITISAIQGNNTVKKLFNYGVEKPCQHFVLGPILINSFNLSNTCKINKGQYDIHINMINKTTMFLGSSFFYGEYSFKVTAMNKLKNFICAYSVIKLNKKK